MAYHHSRQLHKKQKRSKRLLKFSLAIVMVISISILAIFADNFFNRSKSAEIASTGIQAQVESASINIFRTPYFQFQADKSWREINDQAGNENKFVYRSYNEQLVQNIFTIEVDEIQSVALANENTTRVAPVKIEGNRLQAPFGISDHCKTMQEFTSLKQIRMSYEEAEFACTPDGNSFVVMVSLIGGNEIIEHTTKDGKTHTFKLTFQDATFSPSGRALRSILDSFQLF